MLRIHEKKVITCEFSVIYPSKAVTVFHPSSVMFRDTFRV
ncbi:hypothetical protein QFZ77_005984 [Paenibacillus sp. V4I3]|nr:hypothetical protein [Paenibacillus sp. V4I3]MDQ0886810.1 hypothetical protein [Paenibacillus sp. V4I9]